jgi:imidazolonepropionase-like amidohydrolase
MKRVVGLMLALACLATLVSAASAQELPQPGTIVAVKAGHLLDVKSGQYRQDQIILIEGDRIKSVGSASEVKIPAGAKVVNLSNRTVLPGLIDCHTHLTFSPFTGAYRALSLSVPREALAGARNACVALEAGFTTVRNVGPADLPMSRSATPSMPATFPARACWSPARRSASRVVMRTRICWRQSSTTRRMA